MVIRKGVPLTTHLDDFASGQPEIYLTEELYQSLKTARSNVHSRTGQINAAFQVFEWLGTAIGSSGLAGPYGPAIVAVSKVALPMIRKIVEQIRGGGRVELVDPGEFGGWLDEVTELIQKARIEKDADSDND